MAPTDTTDQAQRIARELLRQQAEIRARNMRNGYFARLAYDAGIPVAEIAQTYSVTLDAAYKLIRRTPSPSDCHGALEPGAYCTECGSVDPNEAA